MLLLGRPHGLEVKLPHMIIDWPAYHQTVIWLTLSLSLRLKASSEDRATQTGPRLDICQNLTWTWTVCREWHTRLLPWRAARGPLTAMRPPAFDKVQVSLAHLQLQWPNQPQALLLAQRPNVHVLQARAAAFAIIRCFRLSLVKPHSAARAKEYILSPQRFFLFPTQGSFFPGPLSLFPHEISKFRVHHESHSCV